MELYLGCVELVMLVLDFMFEGFESCEGSLVASEWAGLAWFVRNL